MRSVMLLTLALGGVAAGAFDQAPSISGTWVATREAPANVALAPAPVFGERFGLSSDSGHLTLTRPVRGGAASLVTVHPFDGTEVAVTQTGRPCFGDAMQTTTVTREATGFDFTITSTTPPGGVRTTLGAVYRFRLDDEALTVESTVRDASGERQAGTVYRRTQDRLPPPVPAPNVRVATASIGAVSWLTGDWVATVGANEVEERWMSPAGGAMVGNSRTTRGAPASMVEFEFLCIAERAGGLVYTAMPNGGPATDFLLTRISDDSATFENPDHDFPKTLIYARRADGGYDATISGAPGPRSLTWSFRRK